MANFDNYTKYITDLLKTDLKDSSFKSAQEYNEVLENLSKVLGTEYLKQIETEFPEITFDDMKEFINLNNKCGQAQKSIFTTSNMKILYCSPSALRYIYHSLKIIHHIKNSNSKKVVEIGGGYGGLYLAINIFAPKLNVTIDKYYIIDLPVVTELIKRYIALHMDVLSIPLEIYSNNNYINFIKDNNLFLISNYCFTAIDHNERLDYINKLLPLVSNGFITWQTCFGLDIFSCRRIFKSKMLKIKEETPQTAQEHIKNYYVTF